MPSPATQPDRAPTRLRPDKHTAILAGGREVFARDGYARASIDAIASASGVSTRTIYKHAADKSALFAAVVIDSAARLAEAEVALIGRHLAAVDAAESIEGALRAFALDWLDDTGDWLAGIPDAGAHRALIAQVWAEAAHLGPDVLSPWWRAGAGRVRAELSTVFAGWDTAGWLTVADPDRAVVHFSALVSAVPGPPTARPQAQERRAWIADGVAVFVRAHRR